MHAIQLIDVTVELDGETILKNINLSVDIGETFVIVGPSGSGKTVLIKTMAGIYPPTQGNVICEGENWQNLKSKRKHDLAKHIGVQFQKSALFDALTAAENIAFPLKEHTNLTDQEIEERVQYCLNAVNLSKAHDKLPHDLSGGMRQRLGIARAIALNPEIVFYDDPTAGLDPINSDQMGDLILDLKNKQKSTVILVTHSMFLAYKMAGRIALVSDQSVIVTGSKEETMNHPDPRVQQFIHGYLTGPLTAG
jgi:phospholipid/cholesterol/gamma-HCH transport system ATP-binding protein